MSNLKNKRVITAALCGSWPTKDMNPAVPYTPEEIAHDAYECWKAGAAIVHIHVRNADGTIALGNVFKLTDKAPAGVGADFSIEKLTKSSNPTIGTPVPTGDKANTALYVVLIVLSVLALGGVCFYEVKRIKNSVK